MRANAVVTFANSYYMNRFSVQPVHFAHLCIYSQLLNALHFSIQRTASALSLDPLKVAAYVKVAPAFHPYQQYRFCALNTLHPHPNAPFCRHTLSF